ncbi:unnamed protein product [marine sediment metagenome]|uniref:Uncharacterized protein n=1 Tax=marine sediment metagenome TaxID=412755 RepID=X1FME2_9ZZZZ
MREIIPGLSGFLTPWHLIGFSLGRSYDLAGMSGEGVSLGER